MNLAVSNFAWENNQHEFVFDELKKIGINKVETVLTKIDSWENLNQELILKYKNELYKYGMEPYSMQSLFFNVDCDNLCDQEKVLSHFKRLIEYCDILGVKVMVLGSPNLRKRFNGWEKKLIEIFRRIDDMLDMSNTKLVIEPNSSIYNGQYFHTLGEIVLFLDLNDFRNIKTMIDTHNSLLENSNPLIEISHFFDYINHIHISELKLKPLIDFEFHENFSNTIKKYFYDKTITFELGNYDNFSESITNFYKIYN